MTTAAILIAGTCVLAVAVWGLAKLLVLIADDDDWSDDD